MRQLRSFFLEFNANSFELNSNMFEFYVIPEVSNRESSNFEFFSPLVFMAFGIKDQISR